MMTTVLEQLMSEAKQMENNIAGFLKAHGKIRRMRYPDHDSLVFFIGGDYDWESLNDDALRAQNRLHRELSAWLERAELLASVMTPDAKSEFESGGKALLDIVCMNSSLYSDSIGQVIAGVTLGVGELVSILDRSDDQAAGRNIFLPDTNALLSNPAVEFWRFGATKFELVLLPTVLSELDNLKVAGRTEMLREKAAGLIKRLKGLRGRGPIRDGVPLSSGWSTMRWIAAEPKFGQTLSWLVPDNNDDRIIASVLEVMMNCPRSSVVLVTSDINLQNKAEFAGVRFDEPPESDNKA